MSSRAFRRLHSDADAIKLPASSLNKEEDIDNDQEQMYPNLQQNNRKDHNQNPFELVIHLKDSNNNNYYYLFSY